MILERENAKWVIMRRNSVSKKGKHEDGKGIGPEILL